MLKDLHFIFCDGIVPMKRYKKHTNWKLSTRILSTRVWTVTVKYRKISHVNIHHSSRKCLAKFIFTASLSLRYTFFFCTCSIKMLKMNVSTIISSVIAEGTIHSQFSRISSWSLIEHQPPTLFFSRVGWQLWCMKIFYLSLLQPRFLFWVNTTIHDSIFYKRIILHYPYRLSLNIRIPWQPSCLVALPFRLAWVQKPQCNGLFTYAKILVHVRSSLVFEEIVYVYVKPIYQSLD